jgi:ribosome-interacting GTPase 1
MKTETLLYLEPELDKKGKEQLLKKMSKECGSMAKPHFMTKNPHMMFIPFDEKKIHIHDIPAIAKKYGEVARIVDF